MNRAEIKERVASAINDDRDAPVLLTDAQLNTLIDDAIQILAEDSRNILRSTTLPIRPGMQFVYTPSIAADIMVPTRIWSHVDNRRLVATTMSELDGFQTRWLATTGTPEFWFPISWDLIGIFPRPLAGGGTLKIDYLAWPRELVDDDDEPEFPQASHDAITLWATYQGLLKKWDVETSTNVFKAFQKHGAMSRGRSGINKISARVSHRMQQPHSNFPAHVGIDGD